MKRSAAITPASSTDQPVSVAELQERIRQRAYEIYEQNGRRDGFAENDWLQAEAEVAGPETLKTAA